MGEVVPIDNLLRTVAALYQMRIREDMLSDSRGRARPPFSKFVKEYTMRQYGMSSLANKALADLRVSALKYSMGWSAKEGEPLNAPLPRAALFSALMGFSVHFAPWSERKIAFFFALLAALVPLDNMKEVTPIHTIMAPALAVTPTPTIGVHGPNPDRGPSPAPWPRPRCSATPRCS